MSTSAPNSGFRLEPIERLADVRPEWTRLAAAAGHPFASWEWNMRWWEVFGAGKELHSFVCRDPDGEAVAILPLYVATSRPLRIARFLGYGGWQTPICASEHREVAAQALWEVTRRGRKGCRLILAERLPNAQGWSQLVGGTLVARQNDFVLHFGGKSWEEYLASKSKSFREVVGRRERQLVRERGLTYRLASDPAQLAADFDILVQLHEARWDTDSVGVFTGDWKEFHRRFAADALERGWLRLWFAEFAGEPVAAWYAWRFGGAEWLYQSGRDPRYDRFSVGFTLLAHAVREACRDGIEAFHFLPGRDAYKTRFTDEDPGCVTCIIGPQLLARVARLGMRSAAMPTARRLALRLTGRTPHGDAA